MRILAVPADNGGCRYARLTVPLRQLEALGHEVTWADRLTPCADGHTMPVHELLKFDAVVFQRPATTATAQLIRELARASPLARRPRIVVDLDDDLWEIPRSNPAHAAYGRNALALLTQCCRDADVVTASTHALAQVVRDRTGAPCAVLPNRLPPARPGGEPPPPADDRPTILWAGSGTHDDDIAVAHAAVRAVLNATGGRLRIIGHCSRRLFRGIDKEVVRWIPNVEAYHRALQGTVAIAPLRDNEFNRCKSDIKLKEYMQAGIPVVASPVGPYLEALQRGCPVLLAVTPSEWRQQLTRVMMHARVREDLSIDSAWWADSVRIDRGRIIQRWVEAYSAPR